MNDSQEGLFWQAFSELAEKKKRAERLLLADSADFGVSQLKQRLAREKRAVRNGMALRNSFCNTPAIVVGAGPSLQKTVKKLASFQDRALFFCGGSALSAIGFEPHFAGLIDPYAPYSEAKRYAFAETPFCFQSRVHAENFSLIHGEALFFPENHHLFLNWLEGCDESFDGGWTVATFLVKIALLCGCDPIILVGMDFCYEDKSKYGHRLNDPHLSPLVETVEGKITQSDWLVARNWLEEQSFQKKTTFIDAREGGIPFSSRFTKRTLDNLDLAPIENLRGQVMQKVHALPFLPCAEKRLKEWEESLERCKEAISESRYEQKDRFLGEVAYTFLLAPLWQEFAPLFQEGMQQGEELNLHRLLFFERVIEEHLNAMALSKRRALRAF